MKLELASVDGRLKGTATSWRDRHGENPTVDGGGGPPHSPDMNERIARLEGAADGHKQSQTILAAAVAIVSALLIGGMGIVVALQIFNDQRASARIDGLEKKVDDLPDKIGASIREANRAFSDALAAAVASQGQRQSAPIIIQIPTPVEPPKPAP